MHMHFTRVRFTRVQILLPLALLTLLVAGCQLVVPDSVASDGSSADTQNVTLNFALRAGEVDLACGQEYTLGTADTTVTLSDLRFYVSNIRLVNDAGDEVPLALEQDGLWQVDEVALLDFEDATGDCAESGTAPLNGTVVGTIPAGDYSAIVFDLGVPEALNHADVTLAPSPLNVSAMWWNWRFGYKFVRIDMNTPQEAWFMHVGSVGCGAMDQGATPPDEPCTQPNRAEVRLDNFDVENSLIVGDVASLLANVDVSAGVPAPVGCMSGLDDPDCDNLMPAFGIDWPNGPAMEQQFFRVE